MLHKFRPGAAEFPASSYATPDVIQGTNFPVSVLRFATGEAAHFKFEAVDYGSGNLTIDIIWSSDSDDSGDATWSAELAAYTPETDTGSWFTKSLATANTVTDSHLGTTARRLHRASITLSNLDSIAAGDECELKISRSASGDTLTGEIFLHEVSITYSDT